MVCTWNALPLLSFTESTISQWDIPFCLLIHSFKRHILRFFYPFCFCFHAPDLSRQLSILMYSKHGKVHFKAQSALYPRMSLRLTIACLLIKEVLLIIRGFVYFAADKDCQGNHLHLRQSEPCPPSSTSKLCGDFSCFFFLFLSRQSSSLSWNKAVMMSFFIWSTCFLNMMYTVSVQCIRQDKSRRQKNEQMCHSSYCIITANYYHL